jgi:hypothetical protein
MFGRRWRKTRSAGGTFRRARARGHTNTACAIFRGRKSSRPAPPPLLTPSPPLPAFPSSALLPLILPSPTALPACRRVMAMRRIYWQNRNAQTPPTYCPLDDHSAQFCRGFYFFSRCVRPCLFVRVAASRSLAESSPRHQACTSPCSRKQRTVTKRTRSKGLVHD